MTPDIRTQIVLVLLLLTALSWPLSLKMAKSVSYTDFPVFYWAARAVSAPPSAGIDLYGPIHFDKQDGVEPFNQDLYFIYSTPVAWLFSPLGHLSYAQAKAVFITLNILSYFAAIALLLKALGCDPTAPRLLLAAFCLWMPFLNNLAGAQSNGLILLLSAMAVFALARGRPGTCGGLLGAAALFKLSPLLVAGITGSRFSRVPVGALFVFLASFAIPQAIAWPEALARLPGRTNLVGCTPPFLFLADFGMVWFGIFALIILGFSAAAARCVPRKDLLYPMALGQAAAFLVMPVVEYHHLILLALPVLYLALKPQTTAPFHRLLVTGIPVALINLSLFFPNTFRLSFLGVTLLWLFLAIPWRRWILPLESFNQKGASAINGERFEGGPKGRV